MGEPWPRGAADALRPPGVLAHDAALVPIGVDPASAALALYAKVLAATTLPAAAHGLAAALASDFDCGRVSIGLHDSGRTQLLASSNLDTSNLQAELPQSLVGAMDEAIEQGVSLAWPANETPNGVEAARILIEHAALQRQVGGAVATVPLGLGGDVFGAVCVERHDGPPFAASELARLEQLMALAVPALRWMHHGTQPWHRRAWREGLQGWAALRQPQRRTTRRVLIGGRYGGAVSGHRATRA